MPGSSFINWFVSLDAYGEPVSVSYKGDTTYKTHMGACLTLLSRVFLVFFTFMGVIELYQYRNP